MLLSGTDITDYIKPRHYQAVAALPRSPKLAIIHASSDPATDSYLAAKQAYANDIGAVVQIHRPPADTAALVAAVEKLNRDDHVDGIVVQLPLPSAVDTDAVVAALEPAKDIDGLGPAASFDPATAVGILWLLSGYGIDYHGKTIAVVGQGRLVGAPLADLLEASGGRVIRCDVTTTDLKPSLQAADIIVTAAGRPGLITPDLVPPDAVVIDAAGDADPALYDRADLKITPTPGGVGPMTVAALFDQLLRAAAK
jgi:methylenetetrahydrofolate dehydrogenase (NADP+) / methenyltetrahydrofolate cyclohydrolase